MEDLAAPSEGLLQRESPPETSRALGSSCRRKELAVSILFGRQAYRSSSEGSCRLVGNLFAARRSLEMVSNVAGMGRELRGKGKRHRSERRVKGRAQIGAS